MQRTLKVTDGLDLHTAEEGMTLRRFVSEIDDRLPSELLKQIPCSSLRFLTSEAVGHVGLEDDLAEDGGQRQGLVAFVPQRDVTVASLQAVQRQDALPNQLVVVVVDCDAQHCQICYLSENEGLFVVGRVQSVVHHHARTKLLPDGVCRQTVHVHLNVAAMTPSTGVSEKGSNILSDRRMKSGFSRSSTSRVNSSRLQLCTCSSQPAIWSDFSASGHEAAAAVLQQASLTM